MSGCDRMATPLGTLRLSFAICLFFVAKLYLSHCFLSPCCGYVEFIKFYLFIYLFIFALFTVLACIVFHVYHAYILDMNLWSSCITYLIFKNPCGINFKISGGVTTPQWL